MLLSLCGASAHRSHLVVNASEGGWPSSIFSGPFDSQDVVYCHVFLDRCDDGEGVDMLSHTDVLWCDVDDMVNASHVRVECSEDDDDEEEDIRIMPVECCERQLAGGDEPVYATPQGLVHYATWGGDEPRTVIEGMRILEDVYKDELKKSEQKPILLYYRHVECCDENEEYLVDWNVPLRVQRSVRYQAPLYRALLTDTVDIIESKWSLAMLAEKAGLNVEEGPFPVTYFSCRQALDAVQDPAALFYIKISHSARGEGIQVKTRPELLKMIETGECDVDSDDEEFIIQQGITDLALIGGRRFDIRFYILVHNGCLYMHLNSLIMWTPGLTHDPTSTQQAHDFVLRELHQKDRVYSFTSNKTTGKCKQWLDTIHEQLIATIPVLEPILTSTAENDNLYHIFGGDAMIRENGNVIFTEFNDWPSVQWHDGQVGYLDDNGEESGERSRSKGRQAYEETVSQVLADFFAIVLGLARTDEKDGILEGRVQEVIAQPATCVQKD